MTDGDSTRGFVTWRVALWALAILAAIVGSSVAGASTFGIGGSAIAPVYLPGGLSAPVAVVRQSDGATIVVGTADGPLAPTLFAARFSPSGALDASYGANGIVYVDLPADTSTLEAGDATLDTQGNLLVAGTGQLLQGGLPTYAAVVRLLPSGAPDATFGPQGMRRIAPAGYDFGSVARQIRTDGAGRIVVGGGTQDSSAGRGGFLVARLLASGAPDAAFNGVGYRIVNLSSYTREVQSMAVDPNNRIVVMGYDAPVSALPYAIVRLDANGAIDATFNGTGLLYTALNGAVAVDGAGNVLASGAEYGGFTPTIAVTRFTPVGSQDSTFGTGGTARVLLSDLSPNVMLGNMVVDAAGRVVTVAHGYGALGNAVTTVRLEPSGNPDPAFGVAAIATVITNDFQSLRPAYVTVDAGGAPTVATGYASVFLARLTSSGQPDATFNGTGSLSQSCGTRRLVEVGLARQSDGAWLIGGFDSAGTTSVLVAARLTASGALDPAFGGTGYVALDPSPVYAASASMVVDGNGRVVLAVHDFGTTFRLARYTPAGQLDATFAGTGTATYDDPSAGISAPPQSLAVDSQAAVYVAGNTLTRVLATGIVDAAFGTAGHAQLPIVRPQYAPTAIAVDAADRILMAGMVYVGGVSAFAVARFTVSGVLDTTFGNAGIAVTAPNAFTGAEARAIAIDHAGRIVLAGSAGTANGAGGLALVRFLPNGTPDLTFGNNGYVLRTDFDGSPYRVALSIDAADRLVVTGGSRLARLLSSGAPDATFNAGLPVHVGVPPGSLPLDIGNVAAVAGDVYAGGTAGRSMAMVKLFDGTPTKLAVPAVNGGNNPVALMPFDAVLQSQDEGGSPQPVGQPTTVSLSVKNGRGVLGGNVTCTIPAGGTYCRADPVSYSAWDAYVVLTARVTAGTPLADGDSYNVFVDQNSATVALTSHTPNPSEFGQPITVAATVTGPAAATAAPTGLLFVGEGTYGCFVTPPSGSCTFVPGAAGVRALVASFYGDEAYGRAESTPVSHTVTPRTTYSGALPGNAGNATATFTGGGPTCTFTSAAFRPVAPLVPPSGVSFPYGLFAFDLEGCTPGATIAMRLTLPGAPPSGAGYLAQGGSLGGQPARWITLPASIVGATVSFQIVDGGSADLDILRSGAIIAVGGVAVGTAVPAPEPVPALAPWSLGALALLIALSVFGLRFSDVRRRAETSTARVA